MVRWKVLNYTGNDWRYHDMFGTDVEFMDETEKTIMVMATINKQAMIQFAKNHAPDVEVLEPQELRDKIKMELEKALEAYKK